MARLRPTPPFSSLSRSLFFFFLVSCLGRETHVRPGKRTDLAVEVPDVQDRSRDGKRREETMNHANDPSRSPHSTQLLSELDQWIAEMNVWPEVPTGPLEQPQNDERGTKR